MSWLALHIFRAFLCETHSRNSSNFSFSSSIFLLSWLFLLIVSFLAILSSFFPFSSLSSLSSGLSHLFIIFLFFSILSQVSSLFNWFNFFLLILFFFFILLDLGVDKLRDIINEHWSIFTDLSISLFIHFSDICNSLINIFLWKSFLNFLNIILVIIEVGLSFLLDLLIFLVDLGEGVVEEGIDAVEGPGGGVQVLLPVAVQGLVAEFGYVVEAEEWSAGRVWLFNSSIFSQWVIMFEFEQASKANYSDQHIALLRVTVHFCSVCHFWSFVA